VKRDAPEFPSLEDFVKSAQENVKIFTDQVAAIFTPGDEQKQTLAKVSTNFMKFQFVFYLPAQKEKKCAFFKITLVHNLFYYFNCYS